MFFRMNDGVHALSDLQLAVKCGLPVKDNPDYYAKLARIYACEYDSELILVAYLKVLILIFLIVYSVLEAES